MTLRKMSFGLVVPDLTCKSLEVVILILTTRKKPNALRMHERILVIGQTGSQKSG